MITDIGIISQTPEAVPAAKDALKFDSTYNDAVNIGNNFVTGARTVSFWIKPNITTFNGMTRQFLCVQYGSSGQRTFDCEFFSNGLLRCFFSTTTSGNSYGDIYSDAGVYFNANQWYHICFTIESAGLTKLYIDGVQQSQTHPNTLQLSRTGAPLYWGGFGPYISTQWSDSTMKELAIWTVERTPSEVTADMTRTWTGAETGLKAYFPTNEGNGIAIEDINGVYTGTIVTTNTTPNYINDTMWVVS
jgi:hypothetical protein